MDVDRRERPDSADLLADEETQDDQGRQDDVRVVVAVGLVVILPGFDGQAAVADTLVKDATAAFSREAMQAALEVNWPTFAHSILTTAQLLAEIG
jgi:hypothetical protein